MHRREFLRKGIGGLHAINPTAGLLEKLAQGEIDDQGLKKLIERRRTIMYGPPSDDDFDDNVPTLPYLQQLEAHMRYHLGLTNLGLEGAEKADEAVIGKNRWDLLTREQAKGYLKALDEGSIKKELAQFRGLLDELSTIDAALKQYASSRIRTMLEKIGGETQEIEGLANTLEDIRSLFAGKPPAHLEQTVHGFNGAYEETQGAMNTFRTIARIGSKSNADEQRRMIIRNEALSNVREMVQRVVKKQHFILNNLHIESAPSATGDYVLWGRYAPGSYAAQKFGEFLNDINRELAKAYPERLAESGIPLVQGRNAAGSWSQTENESWGEGHRHDVQRMTLHVPEEALDKLMAQLQRTAMLIYTKAGKHEQSLWQSPTNAYRARA